MVTPKQKIFCDEYLKDLNATRAYKASYKNIKKDETAKAAGSRLLANVNVKEYIDKRMKDREKRTEITQDKVLKELAKIGFADIKDYLEYKTTKTVVGRTDTGEPILGYSQVVDVKDSNKVDTSNVQEVSISKDGTFKFKLYDKQKALVDIGRHLGMFKDKIELSGGLENPYRELTQEQLLKLIED